MADKNATSAAKASSTKQSKLGNLISLAREVGRDFDGIREYTDIIEEKKGLERELGERRKEIVRLNEELAQCKATAKKDRCLLTQAFGEQYKVFDEKNAASEAQRLELQKVAAELKARQEKDASRQKQLLLIESNANSAKTTNETLQLRIEDMQRDCIVHRSQLQTAHAQRDKLESKLRAQLGFDFFHEFDEIRERKFCENLQSLSDWSYAIIRKYIAKSEALMISGPWQSLKPRFPHLPIPSEPSREALLMRHAAGQAIISDALIEHVFRPFYISDDFKNIADQMLDFFIGETEQQNIYRHQVFKILNDPEMLSFNVAASEASEAICKWLDRLVLPEHVEEFRQKVNEFSCRAAWVWASEAQRANCLVEVGHPMPGDEQLKSYEEFGSGGGGRNGDKSDHSIAATLFPRLTMNGKILHCGVVVWSDSPAALIAKQQIPNSTLGRTGTSRKTGRRGSVLDRPAA